MISKIFQIINCALYLFGIATGIVERLDGKALFFEVSADDFIDPVSVGEDSILPND